ncbi:hypothetical protein ACFL0D_06280 [Thermoproteota archaeon]
MSSSRRSRLMRIMEIEQRLHNIESDPRFREMQGNLKTLETNVVGSRHIRIGSPENLKKMIELRRHSEEMDNVIQRYKESLEKYENRKEKLFHEKNQLQKELFPIK